VNPSVAIVVKIDTNISCIRTDHHNYRVSFQFDQNSKVLFLRPLLRTGVLVTFPIAIHYSAKFHLKIR
jgi:hypothetical protein